MGPLVVIAVYIFIAFIISIISGSIIGYFFLPIYDIIRKVTPEHRFLRQTRMALLSSYFIASSLIGIIFLTAYNWEQDLGDYYRAEGSEEWYRWPVEYPFEMNTTHSPDGAYLSKWGDQRKTYLKGITHYNKIDSYIIGKATPRNTPKGIQKWFVFHLKQEDLIFFDSWDEIKDSLPNIGFKKTPEVLPIMEHYNIFSNSKEYNPFPAIIIILLSAFITILLNRFFWKRVK